MLKDILFRANLCRIVAVVSLLSLPLPSFAITLTLPTDGSNVIGQMGTTQIEPGETLADIGRRTDMGLLELIEANPKIHPWRPKTGTVVIIPSHFVLPPGPHEGIVINLPELRLYYYHQGSNKVSTFPLAIGKLGWGTPVANTKIVDKKEDPYWIVPDSILAEKAASGVHGFPKIIPPGPKNPLGKYAIRLGLNGYLIHGTNLKGGIGSRVSHGCMRMQPKDIETLFNFVSVGTTVRIIHEPYKLGFENGDIYLEAHKPLTEELPFTLDGNSIVRSTLTKMGQNNAEIQWHMVQQVSQQQNGWPVVIGHYSAEDMMHYSFVETPGNQKLTPIQTQMSYKYTQNMKTPIKAQPIQAPKIMSKRTFVIDSGGI